MKSEKFRFLYFDEISSTQRYLIEKIKSKELTPPVCVWSEFQTGGIGSRGNSWLGERGNLFFSFAIKKPSFPIESASIYYAFKMKEVLNSLGADVIIKWPNDLYTRDLKKVGGVMSNLIKDILVVGIGINSKKSPKNEFGYLDIKTKNDKILKLFFEMDIDFKSAMEKYKKEFEETKELFDINGSLDNFGALIQNGKRIYSRR